MVVFGVPNEEMGEEVKAVVQLEASETEDESTEQELIEYSRENLAHYKCPRSVDFVDHLPRLPTGKISIGPIKEQYWKEK